MAIVGLFNYLGRRDRESLGGVSRAWYAAKVTFERGIYEGLEKCESVYVDGRQERLLGVLGCGGSKKAFQIGEGRALLLPNMDCDSIDRIALRWKRMVHEEVAMSRLVSKIGLLSPMSQRVNISLEAEAATIPAYLSESFEEMGRSRGWFIIDRKEDSASTWIRGKNFLFQSDEERFNEKNWDSLMGSLLGDIAKLCLYDIPVGGDSINIAIMKKESGYEVRFFGFDFSSKWGALSIPKMVPSQRIDWGWARDLLESILGSLFSREFGWRSDVRLFKDRLVEKYYEMVTKPSS